jgi:hypothetical protein
MGHLRIYFGICFHRIFVRHKSNSRPIVSVGDSPTGAQIFIYTTPYRTLASHVHYRTVVSRLHAPTRAVEILSVVWVPSPHSVESLAYWVTCVGDARVYHLLSVLLAETISADMECSVVHGRLLAVLFNVRSTMEQSSLWSRLLWGRYDISRLQKFAIFEIRTRSIRDACVPIGCSCSLRRLPTAHSLICSTEDELNRSTLSFDHASKISS